ncbi:MAG: tetratricopeptide repeat protein [Anaerolineae bacterium]|nr:tetratricopeptide repeat protein [Anaerolineae bacterium]
MNPSLPPVPQTGRQPPDLTAEAERRLLARRALADETDPFANDADPMVRRLGRLALRRDVQEPADYLALGDLCARLALAGDELRIEYVVRCLLGYSRAIEMLSGDALHRWPTADLAVALHARTAFITWVMAVARGHPTAHNVATALWAAAGLSTSQMSDEQREAIRHLLRRYPLPDFGMSTSGPTGGPTSTDSSGGIAIPIRLTSGGDDALDDALDGTTSPLDPDLDAGHDPIGGDEDTVDGELPTTDGALDGPASSLPASQRPASLPPDLASIRGAARPDPADVDDYRPGDRLGGRYEVRHLVHGGMGVIYFCYDHETRESVAIKGYQSRFLFHERAVARFIQEARTWIRLEKHNNIVQARKVESFGGVHVPRRPVIILEFIAGPEGLGPDLKSWIEHNRLDLATALDISLQICLGMAHAVARVPGLVHRDLKPANILVRHDGTAKVTDFGLVRTFESAEIDPEALPDLPPLLDSRLTNAGHIVGTAPYMSPEQCKNAPLDLRSDVYAFGAILFEMLTGRRVFRARTAAQWMEAHLHAAPEFPPDAARIPADVRALILRCLAKNREQRPASWSALRDELAALYEIATGTPPVLEVSRDAMAVREIMDKAYSLSELGYEDEALSSYDRALALDPDSAWIWARRGRTLRELERYDEALAAYDRALALDPGYGWAWSGRAIVHERRGEHEDALSDYDNAVRCRPNDVWTLYNRASLLYRMGRIDEALSGLDHVLRLDPRHALAHERRGRALHAAGRPQDALAAFDQALALDRKLGAAWLGKGLALRALRQHAESAAAFWQATRLLPNDVAPWLRHADALISLGQHADALPSIQQAARLRPAYRGVWLRLGLAYAELGRDTEAIEAFDRALGLDHAYAPALSGKAEALVRLGRHAEAAACLEAAWAAAPDQRGYAFRLAEARARVGDAAGGLAVLQALAERAPDDAPVWVRLGRAHHAARQFDSALAAFESVLSHDPDHGGALNGKGLALVALGRPAEALETLERAVKIAPERGWTWYNLAEAWGALGRHDDALTALDECLAREPERVEAWARRGQVLRRLGRYPEALDAFERALRLDPAHAYALNGRGLVLDRLRRRDEAIASLEAAVELAPHVVWYRRNLIDPLLAGGQREYALQVCDEALDLVRDDVRQTAEFLAQRGRILRHMNRHEEAIAAYDAALACDPDAADVWAGRGMACAALGRRGEALAAFEKAAQLEPENAWRWYHQGEALVELGRYPDAISALNRALALDPRHRRAKLKRDEARRKLLDEHQGLMQ